MADTIEWLETIGKNANLRHAPADELVITLAETDASEALKAAVLSGSRAQLSPEFGEKPMKSDQSSNAIPFSDEPDEDEHTPAQPPKQD